MTSQRLIFIYYKPNYSIKKITFDQLNKNPPPKFSGSTLAAPRCKLHTDLLWQVCYNSGGWGGGVENKRKRSSSSCFYYRRSSSGKVAPGERRSSMRESGKQRGVLLDTKTGAERPMTKGDFTRLAREAAKLMVSVDAMNSKKEDSLFVVSIGLFGTSYSFHLVRLYDYP